MSGDTTVIMSIPSNTPTALMALSGEWRIKMGKFKKQDDDTSIVETITEGFTSLTNAMAKDRKASDDKFEKRDEEFKELAYKVIELSTAQKGLLWLTSILIIGVIGYFVKQ